MYCKLLEFHFQTSHIYDVANECKVIFVFSLLLEYIWYMSFMYVCIMQMQIAHVKLTWLKLVVTVAR